MEIIDKVRQFSLAACQQVLLPTNYCLLENDATAYSSVMRGVHVAQSLDFCVVFCRSLFVLLCFFFWSLYCLSLFDLKLLIITVVQCISKLLCISFVLHNASVVGLVIFLHQRVPLLLNFV